MNATQPFAHSEAAAGLSKVLIVEDQFMSALALTNTVRGLGVHVVGPAATVDDALRLIEEHQCDAALLDINLGGETVEPVASRLDQMGCPFVFVTGYMSPKLNNPRFKERTIVPKPVDAAVLRSVMRAEFGLP